MSSILISSKFVGKADLRNHAKPRNLYVREYARTIYVIVTCT